MSSNIFFSSTPHAPHRHLSGRDLSRPTTLPSILAKKRSLLPHWMALILTPVVFLLGHVAVPQELSLLSARHGWAHGRPGGLNLLGLILIGIGAAGLFWCARLHFVASRGSFEMERTQNYLVVRGPYQFTRNPMYLSGMVIWLGWVIFYGSVAVLVGFVVTASRSWSALWSSGGVWLCWWCRGRSANWRRDLARPISDTRTACHVGWANGIR